MPHMYMVHVFCDECGVPHPTGVVIASDELISPDQSVGDVYDGRDVPPEIATMRDNRFTCPRTNRLFNQRDNRQVFLVRQLTRVEGQVFENVPVRLDNHEYLNCTFRRCQMMYGATGKVALGNNIFDGCTWMFDGAASLTVGFMTAMYAQGAGGRELIDHTIDAIRRGGRRQGQGN